MKENVAIVEIRINLIKSQSREPEIKIINY